MIYLDHAATTRPDDAVLEAMARCAREAWANPSAPYAAAGTARRALRGARSAAAEALNAAPQEIVLTSGGTEANNLALSLAEGGHAVISAIEHASVGRAAKAAAAAVTEVWPGPDGTVRPEAVAAAIRPDTRLISVMLANNETGAIQPVAAIGALARARRIPFHVDAVQAFGHVPIDVKAQRIDLLSLSAHKFYGPRGAGALYVRQGMPLSPILRGGGQEFGLRAGTENVAAACGMGVAIALAQADMSARADRERALLDAFAKDVLARVPGGRLLCEGVPRLPGLCALYLPGRTAEEAIAALDLRGVCVSGGAACGTGEKEPSRAYRALGLSADEARHVLRVSLGRHTAAEALREAAGTIGEVYGSGAAALPWR